LTLRAMKNELMLCIIEIIRFVGVGGLSLAIFLDVFLYIIDNPPSTIVALPNTRYALRVPFTREA
ncbi:MAG: hypothetical protein IJ309_07820, partial [Clostridia bacterium]|nr:hypothetical protein [Clostridia bacterium]